MASQKDSQKFNLYNFITQDLKINVDKIDYYNAPPGVTYDMLEEIFKDDLDYQFALDKSNDEKNVNFLWTPYAKIMFPKNNFGIYYNENQVETIFQLQKTDKRFSPIVVIESKDQSNIPKPPAIPDDQRLDIKFSKSNKGKGNYFFKTNNNNNNNGFTVNTNVNSINEVISTSGKRFRDKVLHANESIGYNEGFGEGFANRVPISTGGYMRLKKKPARSIKLNKRKLSKRRVQKGGVILPDLNIVPDVYINPYGQRPYNYIDRNGGATNMWGMGIPDNDDHRVLLEQYGHLMYKQEIKIIIDLHSCGTGLHPRRRQRAMGNFEKCNRTGDVDCERKTWELLKKLNPVNKLDNDIIFFDNTNNIGIADMSSGTLLAWQSLININVNILPLNPKKFAIHCQAGYGRTGSVMLLYIMKFHITIHQLSTHFFGFHNSHEAYTYLRDLLLNAHTNDAQVGEVFNIRDAFHAILFISRINYMLVSLAYHHDINNICLYEVGHINGLPNINMNNLFSPVNVFIQRVEFGNRRTLHQRLQRLGFLLDVYV